jgi:hypothetical protein
VIDDCNEGKVKGNGQVGENGSNEQRDRSQHRRTKRISDRPVRSPSAPSHSTLLPSAYPPPHHQDPPSTTQPDSKGTHHQSPHRSSAHSKRRRRTPRQHWQRRHKKRSRLGPLVTLTVAAVSTGAIGALVGEPEVGRMVKR